MRRIALAGVGILALGMGLAAQSPAPAPAKAPAAPAAAPKMVASHAPTGAAAPASMTAEAQNKLINEYCAGCHDDEGKTGGLSLEHYDAAKLDQNLEVTEKMIRKMRAGMMPPAAAKRPDTAVLTNFVNSLENRVDQAAALAPNPGRRSFQRLNRAEYARSVKQLLGIEVDVDAFLPPDTMSKGFDNVADVQSFSPTLMEGYLRAASKIASLAIGERNAAPTEATYKVPRTMSQMQHVDGTPWGTRGGVSVVHIFPADGDYSFRMLLHGVPTGQLFGSTVKGEQIEISINGERVALVDINPRMTETDKNGLNLTTDKVHVKAGPQRVSASFPQRFDGPVDDLLAPIEFTLADTQIGDGFGVSTLPHLRDFSITGPFSVTGVSSTPSRERIFSCRPTSQADETSCASDILKRLATEAYRGPVSAGDLKDLLRFYGEGRKDSDFEGGVKLALQAILASPRFLFRLEEAPATTLRAATYRINDNDLASRLSFFLWAQGPDEELLKAASAGLLHTPAVLEKQVRRMLADPRSEAMATRFAGQWLRLQDVPKLKPDALLFPAYDYRLAESFRRETELLFDSILREDRNAFDLLTADYTFVNERIAKHYGIPNVTGDAFRRVTLGPDMDYRRGLLGQGSILMLTSVADRTSPVQRGKYVMEVLLGTPPPAPPPNVPSLDDSVKATTGGKTLSTRERMEEHRKNPACNSCHRVIDPLGLALENFDVTGQYRIKDNGVTVDANGTLYDGSPIKAAAGLRQALLSHKESFIRNFTENMMTYALGRRVEYYDEPTVRQIVRDAAKNDYKMTAFVMGVVKSPAFQMAKAEPVKTTENNSASTRTEKGSGR